MAWSIFSEGGGKGAAQTWAKSLLSGIGAPTDNATVQVVYDWEVSEGAGGKYNPLNQGPVPGHPELTTTGSQYGGGAADYASWQAGIQGAVDYLNMNNFAAIKKALVAGDASTARAAIISSPWASSHYGQGSSFSTEALPGQDTALPGLTNAGATTAGLTSSAGGALLNSLVSAFGVADIKDLMERGALIVFGCVLVVIGWLRVTGGDKLAVRGAKAFVTKGGSEVSRAAKRTSGESSEEVEE